MQEVVLVHGCPGNAASWEPLVGFLSLQASVTSLSLRDVGHDDPAATLDDCVSDVARCIAAIDSPVTLVGHSFGVWLAAQAAARAPTRISKLLLLSGMRKVVPPMSDDLLGLAAAIESGQLSLDALVMLASSRWLDPDGPDAAFVGAIRALFVSEPPARVARALRRAASASTPIPAAGIPAQVLCCEGDQAVSPALCRELAAHLGADLTVLPGASHFPHWRAPADVARRILT